MGWLTMSRYHMGGHETAKAYLDAQFTYSSDVDGTTKGLKVLASSCPQNRTYYAAAQVMIDGVGGDVFAIVCKVMWNSKSKTGENFGFKDMDESVGPYEDRCPRHILDLLTPTDREYAVDWRRCCRANLERRARKIEDGDRIKLASALTFTDGHVNHGTGVCCTASCSAGYGVSNWYRSSRGAVSPGTPSRALHCSLTLNHVMPPQLGESHADQRTRRRLRRMADETGQAGRLDRDAGQVRQG